MLDSLRPTISTLSTSTTRTTVAPPVAPAPTTSASTTSASTTSASTTSASTTSASTTSASTTSAYFRDTFDAPARRLVSLDGGSTPPVDPPSFLERILPPLGPELKHLEDGWTPQGQGYDAGRGQVLTTYYRDIIPVPFLDKEIVLLSIQDKKSGDEAHSAVLGGNGDFPPPSHGGGVSTDGKFVYVADTDGIYTYTREEIVEASREGRAAEALDVTPLPKDTEDPDPDSDTELISNGSFMTVKGKYAYVGGYSEDGDGKAGAVWRYEVNPDTGKLIKGSREGPIRAPDQAQGIAVVDGALLFTTGKHELVYQPYDEGSFEADIDDRKDISNGRIDPYAQGLNIIDGEVWVTYESGSKKYDQEVDVPRRHIQRIPLEQLDLESAGLTPEDLEG
jgi:hypothetical protein